MRIADVLRAKGAAVVTIHPDATVMEFISGLAEHNIGAMVVTGPNGLEGVASERDVVRQLQAHGASMLARPVSTIMTHLVATCTKADSVDDVSVLMTEHRVRHVPVVADGCLVGMLSIGDAVKNRLEDLEFERDQLTSYVSGG